MLARRRLSMMSLSTRPGRRASAGLERPSERTSQNGQISSNETIYFTTYLTSSVPAAAFGGELLQSPTWGGAMRGDRGLVIGALSFSFAACQLREGGAATAPAPQARALPGRLRAF